MSERPMVRDRVHIPVGTRVPGVTADGQPTAVLPGEYVVHLLRPKRLPVEQPVVRLVGADPFGRDVHLPLAAARKYRVARGNDLQVPGISRAQLEDAVREAGSRIEGART
jgi:hypothetical protein